MQTIIEHIKLIEKLEKNKINLCFIEKYNLQDLLNCCKRIEDSNLDINSCNENIQRELITDANFINYFIEINKNNLDLDRTEFLCSELQNNNEKVSSYDLEIVLQILSNKKIIKETFYNYLKYFSNKVKTPKEQNIVADNLSYFHSQYKVKMSELTETERNLLFLEFMSDSNLIPIDNIKEVCQFLVQDSELKNIILFLYSHNLNLTLYLQEYQFIHKNSKITFEYIQKISKLLDNQNMYQLLLRWVENGCTLYDLKILETKLQGLDEDIISKIVQNRSSYINFIFGNKLSNFPLEDIYGKREKLLIYAISNNKRRFLQLIQENIQEFLSISQDSILYYKVFYEKYVNLNILTLKNLVELSKMSNYNISINLLNNNNYTFQEIKLLCNLSKQYFELYNYLLDLAVDKRMLIIRQLAKRNLLHEDITNEELQKIAQMLKIQHLYHYIEKDFYHIKGLDAESTIRILINYERIQKFIPQIQNKTELLYILRNLDKVQKYNSIDTIKANIENIDAYWNDLIKFMGFNTKFIENNKIQIKQFLLNNGAEFALTYFKNYNNKDLDSFKKIVKAELMGQFKKLKYFADDLHKEINFDLKSEQITEWTSNNRIISDGEIEVKEYDDFYSTMTLGEYPQHTCLSYRNGLYRHCLMACFDSNKKILYAKINNRIVARAMVRLTKGTYNKPLAKEKLSFVDLENVQVQNKENSKIEGNEYLTIFLEKPYIAGVSSEQKSKIGKMFISLLEEKAKNMNALLVLSRIYSNIINQEYVETRYYIYISKSKAGSQYLDSFNGENSITDEGQYRANTFAIWQNRTIAK